MGQRKKVVSNTTARRPRGKPKRGDATKASPASGVSGVSLQEEVDRLTRELADAREQQTSTADILRLISGSTFDLQSVLDTLIASATNLCGAKRGNLFRADGEVLKIAAACGAWPGFMEYLEAHPVRVGPGSISGRVASELETIHVHDVLLEPDYEYGDLIKQQGYRTVLAVPMMRDDTLVGVIMILKTNVEPFSDRQIELLNSFADQAVIAIENVRLFTNLQEALEYQTTTSEVLKVISRSTFDLPTVLDTLLDSAARMVEANIGTIRYREGDKYLLAATFGCTPEWKADFERYSTKPGRGAVYGRTMIEGRTVLIPDVLADPEFTRHDAQKLMGFRAALGVPLMREEEAIGALILFRFEPQSFTPEQIKLVETFADQAIIAIENVRLFTELESRNQDLSEALEQQTATGEVLNVISRSPSDVQPVLDAIVNTAARLCAAEYSYIAKYQDGALRFVAHVDVTKAHQKILADPIDIDRGSVSGRIVLEKKAVHVPDVLADPEFDRFEWQKVGKQRTVLGVPLFQERELTGVIILARTTVAPFTEKQIELVKTFADQAAIAIENTRLFNELRESLQQRTATADVLKAISRSTFDLQTVLDTLTESAALLCDAEMAGIVRPRDEAYYWATNYGFQPDFYDYMQDFPMTPGRSTGVGRALLESQTVHISDVLEDPEYTSTKAVELGGFRTLLAVPLLRDGAPIGVIVVTRSAVRPFSEKQIELVTTFADQAVIAIENVRLFNETRESLERQTATGEVLNVISRSPTDVQPVFETIVQNAVSLCGSLFANVFRYDGEMIHFAASHNVGPDYVELLKEKYPMQPDPTQISGRVVRTESIVRLPDVLKDPEYDQRFPKSMGWRRMLGVPMLRDGEVLGVIVVGWAEAGPVPKSQEDQLKTFADQAVIAIENVRLFKELDARTRELSQSVGELRALGEISQVVSSSLDLETVLTTVVDRAVQLSGGYSGIIYEFDEDAQIFNARATHNISQGHLKVLRATPIRFGEGAVGRAGVTRAPVEVVDVTAASRLVPPHVRDIHVRENLQSYVAVPLVREGRLLGGLVILRREKGTFPSDTIATLQTFAAQSVLAMQNARLYESVEARTRELAQSLEDLRTTQDRLVQTEKLASLGQLTAGIAHEIKNPLNFVNNFSSVSAELIDELQQALGGLPLDEKARSEVNELSDLLRGNLGKIIQHGRRADSIVKNMLLHSRTGSGEHRPVDINEVVEESLNLAYHGARAEGKDFNITLERSFDPAAGKVDLFPQEITRVLLNLIANGFYAARKRKEQANDGTYEPILSAATKDLGDRVEIRIRDNGTGMPPEVKEKLFSPFYTTKPAGEGTGLGLSISHDIIVKQHGGTIEAATEQDAFTEFRIVLPRAAASLGIQGGGS